MITEYIKPFTEWLHIHPHWGIAIAFLVAFTESLAIIGTLIPGSLTLTAIGILIGLGVIPPIATLSAAITGAILGDGLSFWFGWHFRDKLSSVWPFRRYPNLLIKGKAFFEKHGGKSIVIGRFVGPVRSVLPVIAGSMQMPLKNYIVADIISGMLWAPLYMFPGIIIGAASVELTPDASAKLISFILLFILSVWLFSWLIRWLVIWHLKQISTTLDRIWQYMRRRSSLRPITIALQRPTNPEHHGQLVLGVTAIFSSALFFLTAYSVKHQGLITHLNEPLWYLLQSLRTNFLGNIAVAITLLCDHNVILSVFIVIFLWLLYQKSWRNAFYWLGNGLAVIGLTASIKHLLHIARPTELMLAGSSASFPSGHTAMCTAILGFLAVMIAEQQPYQRRPYTYLTTVIIISTVSFSRLYLGAHWLSDVLGAWLLGGSILFFFTLAYRRKFIEKISSESLLIVALVSWGIIWGAYSYFSFSQERYHYSFSWPEKMITLNDWWSQKQTVLPEYRKNRIGKLSQALNVQWSESTNTIQALLEKEGWENIPTEMTLYNFINRLVAYNNGNKVPIIPHLFQNQRPILLMTKFLNDKKSQIILELWPSRYNFFSYDKPLWIGSVYYQEVNNHSWLRHRHNQPNKVLDLDALLILRKDIQQQKWKIVIFGENQILLIS